MKYYGGIDLGGTNSKIGLLDENANLIFSKSIKTLANNGFEDTAKRISETFIEEVKKSNIDYNDIVAVGVGIPGPAINKRICKGFANLPWPKNLHMAEQFEKELNLPVVIDNDVNVIALGEVFAGVAKNYNDVLCVAIGTGIGAGIVSNSKVVSGIMGAAGEIGHLILKPNGMLCGCGHRGCFEAYASATGMVRIAESNLRVNRDSILHKIKNERELEAKDIFDAAKKGDKLALNIVDDEADMIALALSHALNLLNPQIIVIGGGVALAGDFLLDRIKDRIKEYALEQTLEGLEIKRAILDNDGGVYGGAYLAMTEVGSND